jgi:hypothetical protein
VSSIVSHWYGRPTLGPATSQVIDFAAGDLPPIPAPEAGDATELSGSLLHEYAAEICAFSYSSRGDCRAATRAVPRPDGRPLVRAFRAVPEARMSMPSAQGSSWIRLPVIVAVLGSWLSSSMVAAHALASGVGLSATGK